MDKSDLRIEQLQQYLDKKKGVVESNIKKYIIILNTLQLMKDWDVIYRRCITLVPDYTTNMLE